MLLHRLPPTPRSPQPARRYGLPAEDPLVAVGREWAAATRVLCLDELHVTDVADAMILARWAWQCTANCNAPSPAHTHLS